MSAMQRRLVVAGLTILIAFVVSTQVLGRSPFDSELREAARGAVTATGFLEILWVMIAAVFAATRWRLTAFPLRVVLLLNSLIAILLVADFFR